MKSKLTALILAIIFGIIAATGIAIYLNSIAKTTRIMGEKVEVYVADQAIKKGETADNIISGELIKKQAIPRKYVAGGKVTKLGQISGKILNVPLTKGEQLTLDNFKSAVSKGMLAYNLKKGEVAVTISVNKISGVDNRLNPGDKVSIYATFNAATADTAFTRLLLTNITVINEEKPGSKKTGSAATASQKQSLTLAVPASEASRLIFAAETGDVWTTLQKRGERYDIAPATVVTTSVEVNLGAIVGVK